MWACTEAVDGAGECSDRCNTTTYILLLHRFLFSVFSSHQEFAGLAVDGTKRYYICEWKPLWGILAVAMCCFNGWGGGMGA